MNVHVLQHVSFENIGSMESWLVAQGATVSYTRFYQPWSLPTLEPLDLVIVMGGPMSVNDEDILPWLKHEKQFIAEAIQRGISVVGICLGAQLIASMLGSRVYSNKHKEIGWFDLITTTDNGMMVYHFPESIMAFHWHGETFDLPDGAIQLAKSAACINQAFQVGNNVIGLQFHLEATPESVDAILQHCKDELVDGAYIQSEAAIRSADLGVYERMNRLMEDILMYVTRKV